MQSQASLRQPTPSIAPFLDLPTGCRPRSTASSIAAAVEGLLSLAAFWDVANPAMPVIPPSELTSPFHAAARSGACLSLATPLLVVLVRCAVLMLDRVNKSRQQQQQHLLPLLGLPLVAALDEHAVHDLFGIGLSAGMLGLVVPILQITGCFLGFMLLAMSGVVRVIAFLATAVVVHVAFGAAVGACSPSEGFSVHVRLFRGLLALCVVGHVLFLSSCFYSPDVARGFGFVLGFVHIVRLLKEAFACPGTFDDGMPTITTTTTVSSAGL